SATELVASSVPLTLDSAGFLVKSCRLDMLYPLIAIGAASAIVAIIARRAQRVPFAGVLFVAVLMFCVVAFLVGRSQPISYYRYSSFAMPIAIMAGVALFRVLTWPKGAVWVALHDVIVPLVVLVGCIVATLKTYESGSFEAVHINSWRFAIGRYSLD